MSPGRPAARRRQQRAGRQHRQRTSSAAAARGSALEWHRVSARKAPPRPGGGAAIVACADDCAPLSADAPATNGASGAQASVGEVGWMPAIAHSRLPSAGLTRCQTSSNGSATPSPSSRIRPWKRTLTIWRSASLRDVEHLGIDADDVGALRGAAALLQVELDRGEHLRRREARAGRSRSPAVVRRLHADEDHLGDALEARPRRSRRAGWRPRAAQRGGERRAAEAARAVVAPRLSPNCAGCSSGTMPALGLGRRRWRAASPPAPPSDSTA